MSAQDGELAPMTRLAATAVAAKAVHWSAKANPRMYARLRRTHLRQGNGAMDVGAGEFQFPRLWLVLARAAGGRYIRCKRATPRLG